MCSSQKLAISCWANSSDEPRRPHLAEFGIDLHLGEDGAMREHRIIRGDSRVAGRLGRADHFALPGAPQYLGIALAARLVIQPIKPAGPRRHADIAGAEER